jgi:hypothetical protein
LLLLLFFFFFSLQFTFSILVGERNFVSVFLQIVFANLSKDFVLYAECLAINLLDVALKCQQFSERNFQCLANTKKEKNESSAQEQQRVCGPYRVRFFHVFQSNWLTHQLLVDNKGEMKVENHAIVNSQTEQLFKKKTSPQ